MKAVRVRNFAGLGHVEIDELHDRQEVVVAGRNGVGKSHLLMCVALATRSDISLMEARKFIGPQGDTATISVSFKIDEIERAAVNDVLRLLNNREQLVEDTLVANVQLSSIANAQQSWGTSESPTLLSHLLGAEAARRRLPFTQVVYLPADRTVERSPELTFSLSSLARERSFELSRDMLSSQVSAWSHPQNFDVFSSLAALHYAGLLEQGDPQATRLQDFSEIASAFERATGKQINEPCVQDDGSIDLKVSVPGGHTHSINTLSSGELVALQLLHFVRLHYLHGSVLLIDEPEQHLHPSLQVEVANSVRRGMGEGQLWLVTHSPNILQAIPGSDALILSRDPQSGSTEAQWAGSPSKSARLLTELGVAPGLWVPGNTLLVVEGPSDERYLRMLLPDQTGGAYFLVAGNSSSVRSIADKLPENSDVPYLCIMDRDRSPADSVADWNSKPNTFMWPRYAIESIFLDCDWIQATLRSVGVELSLSEIQAELTKCAQPLRERVRRQWLQDEVIRSVPSQDEHGSDLSKNLDTAILVATARKEFYENHVLELEQEFSRLWEQDYLSLVDPKSVLRCVKFKPFTRDEDLINAMIAQLHRSPGLSPAGLHVLHEKIGRLRDMSLANP